MENFDQMAALVCEVDVVISVQNTLIHLAGALGTSTLALLPTVPEWRYGATGEDMLWYPSATLVRQRDDSTWADVFSQVKDRILEMSGVRNR